MSDLPAIAEGRLPARHIRFVEGTTSGDIVLSHFHHPASRYAVLTPGPAAAEAAETGEEFADRLDVILLPPLETKPGFAEWLQEPAVGGVAPPLYLKYRGVELLWRPGRVALQCDPEQATLLLAAVAEFTHFERELSRMEAEIAASWPELDEDRALAFDVTPADLKRSAAIGTRMDRTLQRRMRLARMEPYLYAPDPTLPAAAQKLGEELRERSRLEARTEVADGQLEVFEHVYEMGSQRMGEFRASHQGHVMEWIIIVLLAAEALLMLVQTLLKSHG